ncbi:hypothetical protein II906_03350 [bacterium]|nr:hypothetical protein [bacterium]
MSKKNSATIKIDDPPKFDGLYTKKAPGEGALLFFWLITRTGLVISDSILIILLYCKKDTIGLAFVLCAVVRTCCIILFPFPFKNISMPAIRALNF